MTVIDSPTLKERFWEKVDVRGRYDHWLWTGGSIAGGYGLLYRGAAEDGRKVYVLAHRLAVEFDKGEPPRDDQVVRHLCNQPACVNPVHLEPGSHWDNTQDMIKSGRARFNAPGENNSNAKLTEVEARQILELALCGELSQRKIAAMFNTTQPHVSAIRLGKCWGHLREQVVCPA